MATAKPACQNQRGDSRTFQGSNTPNFRARENHQITGGDSRHQSLTINAQRPAWGSSNPPPKKRGNVYKSTADL
jgi:hypothetical protein